MIERHWFRLEAAADVYKKNMTRAQYYAIHHWLRLTARIVEQRVTKNDAYLHMHRLTLLGKCVIKQG